MSVALLAQAMRANIPAVPKLVLLGLADCADDFGEAQPAVAHLMTVAGCSMREVSQALSEFHYIRLIRTVHGVRAGTVARYEIDIEMLGRLSVPGLWRRLFDERGAV